MASLIGLDSVIFIYLLEEHPQYLSRVERVLSSVEKGMKHAVMSVIGMIEILTGPKKAGREDLVPQYKRLISQFPNLSIIGIDERIVDVSSDLRAKYGIRTPDAIHLATAITRDADVFFTNDRDLLRVKEIRISLVGGNV